MNSSRNHSNGRQKVKSLPAFFYALNFSNSSRKQNRPNVLLMTKKFNLFRLGAGNGTWTRTVWTTRPSNVRVCQFRHSCSRFLIIHHFPCLSRCKNQNFQRGYPGWAHGRNEPGIAGSKTKTRRPKNEPPCSYASENASRKNHYFLISSLTFEALPTLPRR